jgi:hypothetical protein
MGALRNRKGEHIPWSGSLMCTHPVMLSSIATGSSLYIASERSANRAARKFCSAFTVSYYRVRLQAQWILGLEKIKDDDRRGAHVVLRTPELKV